jgi:hypothetical protein
MLTIMAAPSPRFSPRCRAVVAIAAALLVLLQAFVFPPAHAHGGLGLESSATYCAAGENAPATPSQACAHPCVLCAAAAASGAPIAIVATRTEPPPPTAAPPPPRPRMGRAPPGWASSWSSQAPPAAL